MINICLKEGNKIFHDIKEELFREFSHDDILWIDVLQPTPEEQALIEKTFNLHLLSRADMEEIESTSKYSETEQGIVSNLNFYSNNGDTYIREPASFIITNDDRLVSVRHTDFPAFDEAEKHIEFSADNLLSGVLLFMSLLEAHIDHDADILESVAAQVSSLSKEISTSDSIDKEVLRDISNLQDKVMALRENFYDLQRLIFDIQRSTRFSDTVKPRLRLMLKDVESLISHADFSFQRLDNIQNTAMGLINIEQNEIVRILSVAAVVFMPPTLVASLYGMNFKYMPELDWSWQLANGWVIPLGYIFALFLMVLFAGATLFFFRRKKWL